MKTRKINPIQTPYWIRHLEFFNSDVRIVISDPENLLITYDFQN